MMCPASEEIAAAEAYEELFVDGLFAEWAPRVLERVDLSRGDRVLDVACGTGILARTAAATLGSESVVGLDPSAGMLTVAGRISPGIDWQRGIAEELPFSDDSFDIVVSQFGMMFFQDREGALREMRRVLRPRGRLAVAVWDTLEKNRSYRDEVLLLDRLGGASAGDALRAPFVLGDPREIIALFTAAGLPAPEVATLRGKGRFPDIRTMVEADVRGWLPVMGVQLEESVIEEILAEAEEALSEYRSHDGSVEFDSWAHIASVAPR